MMKYVTIVVNDVEEWKMLALLRRYLHRPQVPAGGPERYWGRRREEGSPLIITSFSLLFIVRGEVSSKVPAWLAVMDNENYPPHGPGRWQVYRQQDSAFVTESGARRTSP
jgi:hypothetical protein